MRIAIDFFLEICNNKIPVVIDTNVGKNDDWLFKGTKLSTKGEEIQRLAPPVSRLSTYFYRTNAEIK